MDYQQPLVSFNEICDIFGERKYLSCDFQTLGGESYQVIVKAIEHYSENDPSCKLFADSIWPGGLIMSEHLCNHPEMCRGKKILELGAGVALPSLVAEKLKPLAIVTTDFPIPRLMENMRYLRDLNKSSELIIDSHAWGESTDSIQCHLLEKFPNEEPTFDLILLSETLWKDTYSLHEKLLLSVNKCLNHDSGIVLLSFGHRPCEGHTPSNDLEFFTLAQDKFHFSYKLLTSKQYNDALDGQPIEVYLYLLYISTPSGSLT